MDDDQNNDDNTQESDSEDTNSEPDYAGLNNKMDTSEFAHSILNDKPSDDAGPQK